MKSLSLQKCFKVTGADQQCHFEKIAKLGPHVKKCMTFNIYQVLYDIKTKFMPELDNENRFTDLASFSGFNCLFKGVKHVSPRRKPTLSACQITTAFKGN